MFSEGERVFFLLEGILREFEGVHAPPPPGMSRPGSEKVIVWISWQRKKW